MGRPFAVMAAHSATILPMCSWAACLLLSGAPSSAFAKAIAPPALAPARIDRGRIRVWDSADLFASAQADRVRAENPDALARRRRPRPTQPLPSCDTWRPRPLAHADGSTGRDR